MASAFSGGSRPSMMLRKALPASTSQRRIGHGAMQIRSSLEVPPALLLSAVAAARTTFEAQPPPLGTSLAVLGSTGGVLAYWWLVLVPSERRDLAKNKNKVRGAHHLSFCLFFNPHQACAWQGWRSALVARLRTVSSRLRADTKAAALLTATALLAVERRAWRQSSRSRDRRRPRHCRQDRARMIMKF